MEKHEAAADRGSQPTTAGELAVFSLNEDLAPAVADLHLAAYAGYLNVRLGKGYATAFLDWFRCEERAVALVAVDGASVAGYVVGATGDLKRARNRALLPVVLREAVRRPWLVLDARFRRAVLARLGLIFARSPHEFADTHLPLPRIDLVSIAVSPTMQGRGCGLLLMQEFEARARERQMRSMRLYVQPDNAAAHRLYSRSGWSPLEASIGREGLIQWAKVLRD
jgi:ribosomal protein S18 acetylase RimI-like enzyme